MPFDTTTLLSELDTLRTERFPYSSHFAAGWDEYTRQCYGTLLITQLLSKGHISAQQQRMLDLWLPSIQLAEQQVALCETAAALDRSALSDALVQVERAGLEQCLLLDAMIFSRLDSPLQHDQQQLLGELGHHLKISGEKMAELVYLSTVILGLPCETLPEPDFDLDLSPFCVWDEFLYNYRPNAVRRLYAWGKDWNRSVSEVPSPRELATITTFDSYNFHWWVDGSRYEMPAEIFSLSNLKELKLDLYMLSVAKEIGQLSHLEVLTLDNTSISTLPDEICQLEHLKMLQIYSCSALNTLSPRVVAFLKSHHVVVETDNDAIKKQLK